MAQIGKADEETGKKARFAKLRPTQSIETITLEEAFRFKLVLLPAPGSDYVLLLRAGPVQHAHNFELVHHRIGLAGR